jgi:hypothetical protein
MENEKDLGIIDSISARLKPGTQDSANDLVVSQIDFSFIVKTPPFGAISSLSLMKRGNIICPNLFPADWILVHQQLLKTVSKTKTSIKFPPQKKAKTEGSEFNNSDDTENRDYDNSNI